MINYRNKPLLLQNNSMLNIYKISNKIICSFVILFCCQSFAQSTNAAYGEIKKAPPAKVRLGIKSTQTEFGAMAIADQAKRIEIINLEDGCIFSQNFIKVDFKEPVRFIIKNENDFTVKLMFTEFDRSLTQDKKNSPYKITPVKIQKKQYHAFKLSKNERHVFNWFFNRKKYFRWVCINSNDEILGSAEVQVGNAKKLNRKQIKEIKQNNKFKNLPTPPIGF